MTKTNNLVWRMKVLPSVNDLLSLVKEGVITKEEAKQILLESKTGEHNDNESLESEIKFLRELVDKLSQDRITRTIEIVREILPSWHRYPWYYPYSVWCSSSSASGSSVELSDQAVAYNADNACSLSSIKTF